MPSINIQFSWERSLKSYFRANKAYLYCLPHKYQDLVSEYILTLGMTIPPLILNKLKRACKIMHKEKKRIWYVQKKADYIEGLHMHHSAPKLYRFCHQLRIHTIHELDKFISAVNENTRQAKAFRLKYPQTHDLINYYAKYRRTPPPISFPGTKEINEPGV